jgi:transcriptional regulator GlxA family with amidase domain
MLAQHYPRLAVDRHVLYVDDGDILTSAGVAAGLDCCLHLLRRLCGAEVANRVAKHILVAPHRDGLPSCSSGSVNTCTRSTALTCWPSVLP